MVAIIQQLLPVIFFIIFVVIIVCAARHQSNRIKRGSWVLSVQRQNYGLVLDTDKQGGRIYVQFQNPETKDAHEDWYRLDEFVTTRGSKLIIIK
jgi:hypothetical protein